MVSPGGETAAVEVRVVAGDCADIPAMWLLRALSVGVSGVGRNPI